jgi:chromatin segregation and condensation protein Rec8/ScpA/Scc1 (kleisin family)
MDSFNPMAGTGAYIDMLSGDPQSVVEAKREEKKKRSRIDRERAELLLLAELSANTEAKEIFRRLIGDTLADFVQLFSLETTPDYAWLLTQKIRVKLQVMQDTIGQGIQVMDATSRSVLIKILAEIIQTEVPSKTEVLDGGHG